MNTHLCIIYICRFDVKHAENDFKLVSNNTKNVFFFPNVNLQYITINFLGIKNYKNKSKPGENNAYDWSIIKIKHF